MDGVGFRPSSELALTPNMTYVPRVKLNSIQEGKLKPRKISTKGKGEKLN